MDDGLLMHVLETHTDLFDYSCGFLLWQFFLLFDLLETAIGKGFNDQVQVFLIMKVSEEGSQVGMVQIGLDLYFSQNVVLNLHLADPLLRHLFYHANEAYVLLLSHKHLSECTFAQFLQQLEVRKLYFALVPCVSSLFGSQRFLRLISWHRGFRDDDFNGCFEGLLLFELKVACRRSGIETAGDLVLILRTFYVIGWLFGHWREEFRLLECVLLVELIQILHALHSMRGIGHDNRAGSLWSACFLSLPEKLEVLLLHRIKPISLSNFRFNCRLLDSWLFYLDFTRWHSSHKRQHLATRLHSARVPQIDGLPSFLGRWLSGLSIHLFLMKFIRPKEGSASSNVRRYHTLSGTIFLRGLTLYLCYWLRCVFFLESSGDFPGHAV